MYKYQIRFTNSFGERITYMNIGFESNEAAKIELDKILRQKAKLKGVGYMLNRPNDFNSFRTYQGSNFRIRKIKAFPLK